MDDMDLTTNGKGDKDRTSSFQNFWQGYDNIKGFGKKKTGGAKFDTMINPDKQGLKECDHCNGYGSSLKDAEGIDRCTKCGGSGLIKKTTRGKKK